MELAPNRERRRCAIIRKVNQMADDVPLAFYLPAGLFLKPEARVWIEVKLPEIKDSGKSISNWEVMEKIKALSMPVEFVSLRVSNYTRELIQFEGELDSVRNVRKIVLLLHAKSMKLSGFSELLKLRAKQLTSSQPTKSEWEDYFQSRGVSTFDEGRPGERPDTVKISGLPVKWFTSKTSEGRPCPKVLAQAFQKFGAVMQVGIYDPTAAAALTGRKEERFSSFGPGSRMFYFDTYVQYEKYAGFTNAMNALNGMSLLRLEDGGREAVARITVDFDKTAFLSERNVRKRRRAEERRKEELEEKQRLEEEKRKIEEKKREEEEKKREEEAARRRAKKEEKRRKKREERVAVVTELKNVAVQRRGEAQRLLRTLLDGAAEEKYHQEAVEKRARLEREQREETERKRRERVAEESVLRDKLIRSVHQLEKRRKEVERELVKRSSRSRSGSHRSDQYHSHYGTSQDDRGRGERGEKGGGRRRDSGDSSSAVANTHRHRHHH